MKAPVAPKIVHLIFFPWDKEHQLLPDQSALDRKPYEEIVAFAPDFEVIFWTYDKAKFFCKQYYPDIWAVLQTATRPVMLVDVLRWLVVYHFGGIYWQYGSTPLVPMDRFLPSRNKAARVFTECIITPEFAQQMATEPIRNGEPEELVRIATQVFSAVPRSPFVKKVVDFLVMRMRTYTLVRDYDLLFITANAAATTAYHQFGKDDPQVELVSLAHTHRMIKWHFKGRWRKDPSSQSAPVCVPVPPTLRNRLRQARLRAQGLAAQIPGLRPLYRLVRRR